MLKKSLFLFICLFMFPAHAKLCDRVGIYGEALIFSEHLDDSQAPIGGYNEDNKGLSIGAVCKNEYTYFDWNNALGLIVFNNSYDNTSKGIAFASNLSAPIYGEFDGFGGINIAVVDGYNALSETIRIGDETAILPALTAGIAYNLSENISLRVTANLVPGVSDADGVFLPTFGAQYLF